MKLDPLNPLNPLNPLDGLDELDEGEIFVLFGNRSEAGVPGV